MAIGDSGYAVLPSAIGLKSETTWGSYEQPSRGTEFLSCSFMTDIESKKIESIGSKTRGYVKRVQLNKTVAGSLDMNYHHSYCFLPMHSLFAGIQDTSAVSTGSYVYTLNPGNYDTTTTCLGISAHVQKGDFTFRYTGGRVNKLSLSAEAGDVVKSKFDFVFKDSTQTTSDKISSGYTYDQGCPVTFAGCSFKYGATESDFATTSSLETIQGFTLEYANGLVTDSTARQLGNNTLGILLGGRRDITLTVNQRFDTVTSYNRAISGTVGALQLILDGANSLSTEVHDVIYITMPRVYVKHAEPLVENVEGLLTAEITYDVVQLAVNTNTTPTQEIKAVMYTSVPAISSY